MKLLRYFIVFVLVSFCFKGKTQSPSFIHYEVGNGLTSNELYNLKQDSKGYLWIGTDAGLTRFNGQSFELYSNKMQNGASVSGIQEDSKGNIWCYNFSGQIFTIKNDSLVIFNPWTKHYNNQLIEITVDKEDNLYVSNFKNAIYKFGLYNNKFEILGDYKLVKQSVFATIDNQVVYSNLSVKKLFNTNQQEILFNGLNNLQPQDSVNNAFVFFNSSKNKQTFGFQRQHYNDKFPSLYTLTNNTLTIHPITAYLRQLNIYPLSLLSDDEGNIFIGTFKGCYWFKQENNVWRFYQILFDNKAISSIIKDREGSYWFATLKNGLYQIPNLNIKVFSQNQIKLPDNVTGSLTTDNSNIYVSGAATDITVINATNNLFVNSIKTPESRDVQGFLFDTVFKRLLLFKNDFYILNNKKLNKYSYLLSASKDFFVRKDGVIFSAGVTLVAVYPNGYNKEMLEQEFSESEGLSLRSDTKVSLNLNLFILSNQRSRAVWYNYKHKLLWSAEADGVVFFKQKQKIKLYDSVSKQFVVATSFAEDAFGLMYIATIENGIYVVDGIKIVKHITTANELLANRIKKIKIINNQLFVVTNVGLQIINIKTNTINNLTISNGLVSSEIIDIAAVYNKLYVSTTKGLQVLPINFNSKNYVKPYLDVKQLSSLDSVYSLDKKISIPSSKSNISIYLDGVALKSRGNFKYKYRLLGLDSNWTIVASNNNIVRYPTLPSGKYIFEATIVNEDGIVGNLTSINFDVTNPWYLQWWFLSIALLLLMFIIFKTTSSILVKKRKQVEEALKQSQVQEALRKSQLSSLKAQMNPHFMFNALNSIQEFILLNDKKQANMFMGKFADLMRLTLDHSNKETISLSDEIKILELYLQLESLRFEEGFSYTINYTKISDLQSIQIPAMLIQPYVENAVKHGLLHKQGNKNLEISFLEEDDELVCLVKDNGIGRKRSEEINKLREKKYTSFATSATQKRLELLNYNKPKNIVVQYNDCINNNGLALGTEVKIIIPIYT